MVKRSNASYSFVLTSFALLLILLFVIGELFTIHNALLLTNDTSIFIPMTIALLASFVVPSIFMIVIVSQGSRYNRRRQAAARHDPTTIIYPRQPSANAQEYSLPMTITLYPTEEILLGTVSIWRVGISLRWGFLFAIVLAWIWQRIFPSRTWLEIFGEIWLLAFFVWALIMIFKRSLVQITLTEEEIQISQFGKERAIAWKDARLFSVIAVKRHGADTYYELSSEQRILRWNWDRSPRGLLHSASLQEYNQQMEAVLAIIVAKTGLTLYDLRNMPIPS